MNDLSTSVLGGLPKGVVEIPQAGMYVREEAALESLFALLRERGYETKETEGGGWFASLRDDVCVRMGKCPFCDSHIEVAGIHAHGRDCEFCGKELCREYVDGGTIEFIFAEDRGFHNKLRMTVKRFDHGTDVPYKGELVLYADPPDGDSGFWSLSVHEAKEKLQAFEHLIRRFEEDGVAYIGIPIELGIMGVINTCKLEGGFKHGHVIKLYKDKEYSDFFDRLPVPETISIYKAWEDFPLEPSETLHESILSAAGLVSRCDYYYQDGRPEIRDIHILRMQIFVEHFTTLDRAAWDEMVLKADKSGPGFIRAAAAFCQGVDNPIVRNDPNIGNLIHGVGKIASGQPLTGGEVDAMELAASDPDTLDRFSDIFKR